MLFEILSEASARGELILIDGGFCHWHLRRDGQITIREILVLPERRGQGIGSTMLAQLAGVSGAKSVFAKCPVDLPANDWYKRRGFDCEGIETTRTGRRLKLWRLPLS